MSDYYDNAYEAIGPMVPDDQVPDAPPGDDQEMLKTLEEPKMKSGAAPLRNDDIDLRSFSAKGEAFPKEPIAKMNIKKTKKTSKKKVPKKKKKTKWCILLAVSATIMASCLILLAVLIAAKASRSKFFCI